jgi:hypothetical protein
MSTKLTVIKIPVVNSIVIKQYGGRDFFISAPDSIIISPQSLAFLLSFLVENGFISEKLLEGVLEGFYTQKGRDNGSTKDVREETSDTNIG